MEIKQNQTVDEASNGIKPGSYIIIAILALLQFTVILDFMIVYTAIQFQL